MTRIHRSLGGCLVLGAALLTTAGLPTASVRAQSAPTYEAPLPVAKDMQPRGRRHVELSRALQPALSGVAPFDDTARRNLTEWLRGYVFRAMTDPAYYSEIADLRGDLVKAMRNTRNPEVQRALVTECFRLAQALCDRNYPPPTRINAMLLIADLNQSEGGIGEGGARQPAVPYAPALEYMLTQLKNPNQIDGVRIAALSGIQRHVDSQWFLPRPQIAPEVLQQINTEMLAIARQAEPPENRSPEAHAWIRSRAVDVLGGLIGLVPSLETYNTLVDVMDDYDQPLWMRVRAAYALGRVDYARLPEANTIKKDDVAAKVAGVLADACRLEVDRLEKEREKAQRSNSPYGMMAGLGMGMPGDGTMGLAMPGIAGPGAAAGGLPPPGGAGGIGGIGGIGGAVSKEPENDFGGLAEHYVTTSRRRLLYNLSCIRTAVVGPSRDADFKGLKAFTNQDPAAQKVARVEQAIRKVTQAVDKKGGIILDDMLKEVRAAMQDMEQLRPPRRTATPDVPDEESAIPTDLPDDVDEAPAPEPAAAAAAATPQVSTTSAP